jgi:hypothetical protein
VRYAIVVRGAVDPRDVEGLAALEVRLRDARTELVGEIVDQSQLVGILSRLSRAGIEVISAAPVGEPE